MMTKTTFFSLLVFVSFGLFYNFSGGPAGGTLPNGDIRMEDRTGSPFATQGTNCSTCHNNGNFDTNVTVELLKDGEVVSAYTPGIAHKVRYTINTTTGGSPMAYGWQSVLLNASDENAGTFGDAPSGFRVAPIDSRSYFEHTAPHSTNVVEIDWTAPAMGSGPITVYTGAAALDANGNTNGDNGVAVQTTFEEGTIPSSATSVNALPVTISVLGNPVQDVLNLEVTSEETMEVTVALVNTNGQQIMEQYTTLTVGKNTLTYDASDLATGVYFLQLQSANKVSVKQIIVE